MPIYEFRCRTCGRGFESQVNQTSNCICGDVQKRVYSFATVGVTQPFQPHFNNSVGQVVHSQRDFEDKLKVASEKQSVRTGAEHRYVPVDSRDIKPHTDEGMEDQARTHRDSGSWQTTGVAAPSPTKIL